MTIYEAYINGKLYQSVTKRAVLFHCELYGAFKELREEMGYEQALYSVADKKCCSPKTVEAALQTAKKPL